MFEYKYKVPKSEFKTTYGSIFDMTWPITLANRYS